MFYAKEHDLYMDNELIDDKKELYEKMYKSCERILADDLHILPTKEKLASFDRIKLVRKDEKCMDFVERIAPLVGYFDENGYWYPKKEYQEYVPFESGYMKISFSDFSVWMLFTKDLVVLDETPVMSDVIYFWKKLPNTKKVFHSVVVSNETANMPPYIYSFHDLIEGSDELIPFLQSEYTNREVAEFQICIQESKKSQSNVNENNIILFLYTICLGYIAYLIEQERTAKEKAKENMDTNLAIIEENTPSERSDKTIQPKKTASSSNKRNVIKIGDFEIERGVGSKITRSKIMHRRCPAWTVRGHKRVYKSGKVVNIKPFVKGKKRNEMSAIIPKTYNIVDQKAESKANEKIGA